MLTASGMTSPCWLPKSVAFLAIPKGLLSQLEVVEVTLTVLCLCRLVHEMQVVETRLLGQG